LASAACELRALYQSVIKNHPSGKARREWRLIWESRSQVKPHLRSDDHYSFQPKYPPSGAKSPAGQKRNASL